MTPVSIVPVDLGEVGNSAYYTFKVDVRSAIDGSLSPSTVPNSVLEQYSTFTNLTDHPLGPESLAYYRSYLNRGSVPAPGHFDSVDASIAAEPRRHCHALE